MFGSIKKTLAVVALCLLGYAAAQNVPSTVSAQDALFTGEARYRQGFSTDTYEFTFPASNAKVSPGGSINVLTIDTDPATYGTGIGQNLVSVNPNSIVQPHFHPRSTEVLFVIAGQLTIGIAEENGGRTFTKNLGPGSSIFIPQGYLHFIQNHGSQPGQFISSFANPDFGTLFLNDRLFSFGPAVIADAFGLSQVDAMRFTNSAKAQAPIVKLQ